MTEQINFSPSSTILSLPGTLLLIHSGPPVSSIAIQVKHIVSIHLNNEDHSAFILLETVTMLYNIHPHIYESHDDLSPLSTLYRDLVISVAAGTTDMQSTVVQSLRNSIDWAIIALD